MILNENFKNDKIFKKLKGKKYSIKLVKEIKDEIDKIALTKRVCIYKYKI